jgi:SAM-dependent methyltransferase
MQVQWIHTALLEGRPADILDLGCGPGLYCNALAGLGHTCTGIDFGPASIAYARQAATRGGLSSTFIEGDLRATDFGAGRQLIMLVFGEFNTFQRAVALELLTRSRAALAPDGWMLIEAHTLASLRARETGEPTWSARARGLFSDAPYVCLNDACWHEHSRTAVERHYVIDAATAAVSLYGTTTQGYTRAEYETLFRVAGFSEIVWRADWPNPAHAQEFELAACR